jgi:hypothetical protein
MVYLWCGLHLTDEERQENPFESPVLIPCKNIESDLFREEYLVLSERFDRCIRIRLHRPLNHLKQEEDHDSRIHLGLELLLSNSTTAENRTDSSGSLHPMNPSLEYFFAISTTLLPHLYPLDARSHRSALLFTPCRTL